MALYRALRGVCIGVDKHLVPGAPPVEIDPSTARFLVSIGAVEAAPDEEAEPAKPTATDPTPGKSGSKEKSA